MLRSFMEELASNYSGSLIKVKEVLKIHGRAKEYLHRLSLSGAVKRVGWGWYWVPARYKDPLDFLSGDKGFKVLIDHTAASLWNYGFIKHDTYRIAVVDRSYKRALESFAELMGWKFEVKYYHELPFNYVKLDELLVEELEHCIASCVANWEFLDGLAALYIRKEEVDFEKLKAVSRWKRVAGTNVRVWAIIKYACKLFNEELSRNLFDVRRVKVSNQQLKELVSEVVAKVVELA